MEHQYFSLLLLVLIIIQNILYNKNVYGSGIPFGTLGSSIVRVQLLGNNEAEMSAIRAPCVFRADEEELHKYAAILAATEPFRSLCNTQIKKAMNPIDYIIRWLSGRPLLNHALTIRAENKAIDLACDRYETRVESTLRSYGMSAEEFNTISTNLNNDPILKQRIMLQAYYYKIAADLEANLQPALPLLPSIGTRRSDSLKIQNQGGDKGSISASSSGDNESSLSSGRKFDSGSSSFAPSSTYVPNMSGSSGSDSTEESQIRKFCKALRAIEMERLRHRDYIKSELRIQELPQRMSDPEILPAMSPIIQRLSQEFPKTASQIIARNGLHIEEFNLLQEKVEKNFFYRFAVQNEIKKIEEEIQLSSAAASSNLKNKSKEKGA